MSRRATLALASCLLASCVANGSPASATEAKTTSAAVASSSISLAAPAAGMEAGQALGTLVELSGVAQRCDVDLLIAGASARSVVIQLVDAGLATQRQAFAHALGSWWAIAPGSGAIIYTRDAHLPHGAQTPRWATSGLRERPALEPAVAALLAPWLGGDAGLSYEPAQGLWPATLDAAGHAHLTEILSLLERPAPQCPDLVPDAEQPDLERRIETPLRAETWGEMARLLSAAGAISVALGPGLPASASARDIVLEPGSIAEACAAITRGERAALHAEFSHGVLCIDTSAIEDREHPGTRRRLAVLPIGHLLRSDLDGELLAVAITHGIAPEWWKQPGAGITYLRETGSLLVAAEPRTIHMVLDAIDRLDQLGFEQGLPLIDSGEPPRAGR